MEQLSIEQFGLGDRRTKEFVRLPWRLYKGDPNWTPPLNADYLGNRLLGIKGLLTAEHPYHKHARVTHFLARRGNRAVGRVSAAVNERFNDYYGSKIGSFGFFEVEEDYEAAAALLDAARKWLVAEGMSSMRGPGEYSNATHERQGVLIEGFDTPPTVECTHNPPYYADYLEHWGLAKVKDYHAYIFDVSAVPGERLARLADAVRDRSEIETRKVRMEEFDAEVRRIIDVYNRAWSQNWGFLPILPEEADSIADSLRLIVDPGMVRFASVGGDLIATLGAFPDPNWALRPRWGLLGDSDLIRIVRLLLVRRRIPRLRLMFFGVAPGHRKSGVDALLFEDGYRHALEKGYKNVEASLLLEDNDLILRPSRFAGGKHYKTWRIFERAL